VIGRVVVALLIVLVSALTYPGAVLVSFATRLAPAPATTPGPGGDLPWLHVEHPSNGSPYIADDQGRMVLLHGAIPASLLEFGTFAPNSFHTSDYVDGKCPPSVSSSRYPPLCRSDLEAMAALGFNSIRLPLSWSLLEPQRGRFDTDYVDHIAQVVDWARELQLYVIVDMHQNAYSYYVGAGENVNLAYNSGAPQWATFTDGIPSRVFGANREVNPAVLEANSNFWYDRAGIQDEYIAALAFIAKRFRDDPVVAGFGVYNEPWLGWNLPPGFEDLLLFPFYRRVLDALTGARDGLPCWSGFFMPAPCGYRDLGIDDTRHLFFLDTGLFREVTDFPTHLGLPVSSYPNVVLAMHAYTHVYTLDTLTPWTDYPPGGYDQSYASAQREARAMDAALFVSEFGSPPDKDGTWLSSQLVEQEQHRLGFAFWPWKESTGSTWGMFDPPPNECLRTSRERLLARVYPRATADRNLTFHYDASDGLFALHAHGSDGDASTVVYIPPEVTGQVTLDGAVRGVVSTSGDGSRLVLASPTGGSFVVGVAPAPLRLTGCH
jgi:endoglycosylceramidase